jgi:hypothetical protein
MSIQVLEYVGRQIEITEIIEDENGLAVRWLYTVKQAFTIEGQSWDVGDTFEFDISLQEVDGKWRVAGI